MSQQTSFGFPVLEAKDIIQYLRSEIQNDMDVSEADFRDPQRERWQKFYTLMLCDCCLELNPETLNVMPITMTPQHPELYEESAPLLNVSKSMQAVLATCGVFDFKMSDILFPKSKRLVKFCSAIINFRRFQEERLLVYKDIQGENEALQDQRDTLLKENEELQQRINNIKRARAEKEPEIQMIKDDVAKETSNVESLQVSLANVQRETNELKTSIAEKKSSIASLKEHVTALRHENSSLSSQIVPSPDRLKGEMQRMERQVQQLKMSKEEAHTTRLERKGRRQLQEKRDQEADQAIKLVMAVKEQMDNQRATQLQLDKQKEEGMTKQDEIKTLDARMHQVRLQLSILQENLSKCTMIYNSRVKEMKASQEILKSEREKHLKSFNAEERSKQSLMEEKVRIQQEQAKDIKQHIENVTQMQDAYEELLKQLDEYHNRLGQACQKMLNA